MHHILRAFSLCGALVIASLPSMTEAQACQEIKFQRGTFGTVIKGVAPANGTLCYTMGTGSGQTAKLQVLDARNTIFSVVGVADGRDALTFRTRAQTYQIIVSQMFRSATDEAFSLVVEVR